MSEKGKNKGDGGSHKSPTKFMERPKTQRENEMKEPDQNEESKIGEDLDTLGMQEKEGSDEGPSPSKPGEGHRKQDNRQSQSKKEKEQPKEGDDCDCS